MIVHQFAIDAHGRIMNFQNARPAKHCATGAKFPQEADVLLADKHPRILLCQFCAPQPHILKQHPDAFIRLFGKEHHIQMPIFVAFPSVGIATIYVG